MDRLPSEIGPYRVTRLIGEGGMGAVYEAVHQTIHRQVAIKVLHPDASRGTDAINRFINEARAANIIRHAGLVQVTDFGSLADGSGYLVMEYLPGETLAQRIEASGGKLSPEESVNVGIQIASALAACHKHGVVHRDLKPGNVMLVPDPAMATGERLKVLDFGLAKLSEVREAVFVKTQSQAVFGTPLYMSPEQCEGAGRVDAQTDVYALGCMLYEMLVGRPPFVGDGTGQVIGQHLFKQPVPIAQHAPTIPEALSGLVDRMLVKSKDERPTMRDVQKELEEIAKGLPSPPRREFVEPSRVLSADSQLALGVASTLGQGAGETTSQGPKKRSLRRLVGGIALLLLLVAGLTLRQLFATGSPSPTTAQPAAQLVVEAPKPVTLRVDSKPLGATLVDASSSEVLGKTPFSRQAPPQNGTQKLVLRLTGYQEQSISVNLASDEHAQVTLSPQPAPPAKKPVLKRFSASVKKLAGKVAEKFKKKKEPPPKKPASKQPIKRSSGQSALP